MTDMTSCEHESHVGMHDMWWERPWATTTLKIHMPTTNYLQREGNKSSGTGKVEARFSLCSVAGWVPFPSGGGDTPPGGTVGTPLGLVAPLGGCLGCPVGELEGEHPAEHSPCMLKAAAEQQHYCCSSTAGKAWDLAAEPFTALITM